MAQSTLPFAKPRYILAKTQTSLQADCFTDLAYACNLIGNTRANWAVEHKWARRACDFPQSAPEISPEPATWNLTSECFSKGPN